jgi:predicted ArsR family transcriptional regulator
MEGRDGPTLGESRTRVLSALQAAAQPLGVDAIAEKVGLHANTARFHLDGLVEQGLARRTSEERSVPGRPRTLYAATPDSARTGRRSYRLLAEILTAYVAGHAAKPAAAAREAGESWGRLLAGGTRRRGRSAAGAVRELVETLDDIGFAPEPTGGRAGRRVLLHHCPFREAAEQRREVVCAVHLGLMQGLLDEIGAPVTADRLDPFVEPNLCVAHLGPARERPEAAR